MDLDLGAPDSTVVAPSPKPMEKPSQPTSEVLPSDPSMEFSASLGEESVKKEESKEFIFEKPRSTEEMKDLFAKSEPKKVEEKVGVKVSDESVIKLEAIIRALREEREQLLKEVNENKNIKDKLLAENLNREAEVEELRVELSIVKKRNEEEFHEESYEKRNLKEKLSVAEEKNQRLQKDLDILNQQAKIDTNKILQKEKDLESQLELLSIDSQNQILSREKKISELKRERDTMEYNMTNLVSREKKLRQEKIEIEEKLNKIMRTMRSSIQFLEEEIEGNENLFKELKK
jgi:hypothetical protein